MNLEEALEILESVIGDKVKAYREAKKEAKKVAKAIDTYEEVHKGQHPTPYRGQLEVKLEDAKKGIRATKTNEALELMEDIYDAIEKRHGEPKSSIHTGKNRAAELFDKVHAMKKAAKEAKKNVTTAKMSEAISIAEEMLQLANSIFEVAPEAPVSAEEVPPSNNEIKQTKKDKENPEKKREVVSVADELFPYEGNAKQQMNQKILAKINQMIEGTATLEDLLQLVRRGTKKAPATK